MVKNPISEAYQELRTSLEQLGITGKAAAESAGMSSAYLSMLSRGVKSGMSPLKVWRLVKIAQWTPEMVRQHKDELFGTAFRDIALDRASEELVAAAAALASRNYAMKSAEDDPECSLHFRLPVHDGMTATPEQLRWARLTVTPEGGQSARSKC